VEGILRLWNVTQTCCLRHSISSPHRFSEWPEICNEENWQSMEGEWQLFWIMSHLDKEIEYSHAHQSEEYPLMKTMNRSFILEFSRLWQSLVPKIAHFYLFQKWVFIFVIWHRTFQQGVHWQSPFDEWNWRLNEKRNEWLRIGKAVQNGVDCARMADLSLLHFYK
jgi:hypothetical protein